MKISALDLKKQIAPIRRELDLAIKGVIDDTGFILGPGVGKFEKDIAKYCAAKYAVGVSNGTDALSLSLLALGIKSGEGVICPAFTYYATAGAIAAIGARPVFADIDKETYNISIESVEKILLKQHKFKLKAVIPVHLYGQCADMSGILRLARKYKLRVIEDAAQSFGAEYRGKKAGTLGDCGAVSFYPAKNLGAFGDAGAVLTNNRAVNEKLRILRNQGNKNQYFHSLLGRNNRMDTFQAVVLGVKLKYLDAWNKQRQEVAGYFNKHLSYLAVKLPFTAPYSTHIYHQYVLRVPGSNKGLLGYLRAKGIDSRVFYPLPLHLQKCFKYLGYKKGDFPEAEKASRQTLTLPIDPNLTGEEKDYIIQQVRDGSQVKAKLSPKRGHL
ncbi:MAG: DegT/DnrJ/EryC1/StrS family aminotransferase [Candidatus Omnitrophica bacterium]|nr:DegT/DnrJ/EryC1/StrS family aminotransferase [Candidatus Omnitrophota bacterium]